MNDNNHDHDRDHDRDHEPDGNSAVAPAPSGGALAALATLGTVLNAVDTSTVAGRSGMPMLQFKRDGNGTWMFGQKRTIVEEGSKWAVNPTTFKRGWICFSNDNKVVGEQLLPVSHPMPDVTELPDKGFPWQQQWSVNVKCIGGTDAGVEAIYKPTTVGGIQAVTGLIDAVRDRLNGGMHDGKVSPIVLLEKGSYPHSQFGKIWTPTFTIADWMPITGPAPAPAPTPTPAPVSAEQPRRRRVG